MGGPDLGVGIYMKKNVVFGIVLLMILVIVFIWLSNIRTVKTTDLGIINEVEIVDNSIYYIDRSDNSSIYKLNKKNDVSQISINSAFSLEVYQGNIYYINMDDNYHIYELNLETNKTTKIIDNSAKKMKIIDGYIFFISTNNGYLYRINLDGSGRIQIIDESCIDFTIDKNNIYYLYHEKNEFAGYYFSRSDIGGTNRERVLGALTYAVDFDDDWIYYSVPKERKIYKVRYDGIEKIELVDASSYYLKLVNDQIYYLQDGADSGIYKIDTDGNSFEKIDEGFFLWVDIIDNWLIYRGLLNNQTNIEAINDYHKTGTKIPELLD